MIATRTITRLARTADKTYGVGAIVFTHGDTDAGNSNYEQELHQLWLDYNSDLRAITGQKQKIQMIVSQQNSCADRSTSTLAQWKIGADYTADIVCSGPKYQYPSFEGIHLTAEGYRLLGEKYAEVYYQRVILGNNWEPLQPSKVNCKGNVITIHYHVPVPPLVWETRFEAPHPSIKEWSHGNGFEVTKSTGEKMAILSAEISGDAVVLTCASDPGRGARVGYAMIGETNRMATPYPGTFRWGLLRDSDPFRGVGTQTTQSNYGIAFEMAAP